MAVTNIILVSSEPSVVQLVTACFAGAVLQPEVIAVGSAALHRIAREPAPHLVLLEIGSDGEGLQTLKQVLELYPELIVVVLVGVGETRQVIEAIHIGARDYITVPFRSRDLLALLHRYIDLDWQKNIPPRQEDEKVGPHFFVVGSPTMQKIRVQLQLLADIDVPVLILGESGTGKEVVAQLLHNLSARSSRRFLKVNCAALPAELLESELFGYERGAFTGAMRTKAGKFELCEKGTILLDEVAEMPANLQAKLLHVLQDKQFFRLGGETTMEVDIRILAATNVNIQEAMAEKRFREDLYYRLSAFTICLPPLRDRKEEIPMLLRHFMERIASQYSRPPLCFSQRLLDACVNYSWPGNVRELQNFVKRYVVMADENLAFGELKAHPPTNSVHFINCPTTEKERTINDSSANGRPCDLKFLVRNLKDEAETQAITNALRETDWNRKRAARLLHISYRGLLNKIRQHAILPPTNHLPTYNRDAFGGNRALPKELSQVAVANDSATKQT